MAGETYKQTRKEGLKNRLPKQILPLPMGIHDTALERNLICVSVSQSFSPDSYQKKLTGGVSENFYRENRSSNIMSVSIQVLTHLGVE